jgi:hypothetical protein
MSTPLQRAHEWWETLGQADRQRVWNARHSYLAGDLVEQLLERLSQAPDGAGVSSFP